MFRLRSLGLLAAAGVVACTVETTPPSGEEAPPPEPGILADLRADSNRDGEVRFDDDSDANKREWNETTGAVFLANIDDDSGRCKVTRDDRTIASCNDAADEIVNGPDDALDLARLKTRPWPKAPDDAAGRVRVVTASAKDMVRLFWRWGPGETDFAVLEDDTVFTSDEIREGIELAIEAKDIVRDTSVWDGYVDIEFTVTSESKGEASDTVRMRVAPVLVFHHLLPAETIWVSNTGRIGNREMRADLTEACAAAGLGAPETIDEPDPWTQDFFEPAYMSMPGPGGSQHVMRVNYRSANVFEPHRERAPLRPAGRFVFELRGKDVAGVQQFDIDHDEDMDTLNSFGNLETIPPYEKDGVVYPFGRVLLGSSKWYFPDTSFSTMLEAQQQQPEVAIDTSWLLVAHVDETLSFVKANTPRGWKLLANDPRLAREMLEEASAAGHGDTPMFVGKSWYDYFTEEPMPAEATIDEVLADTLVMQASAEAAAEVDAQVAIIQEATGLSDDEIVRVPFLHTVIAGKSGAYQPGIVNGLVLSDTLFGAPDPHGPVIDGKDIFKTALEAPLAELGIDVSWIEDWDEYHVNLGDVHCATNSTRQIPAARWWETGR